MSEFARNNQFLVVDSMLFEQDEKYVSVVRRYRNAFSEGVRYGRERALRRSRPCADRAQHRRKDIARPVRAEPDLRP